MLTWLSSTDHACGAQKDVIMDHVDDTAFCPGKKPISPGRVGDTYGKPFYYLLSKIDILYIISDILYRI